MRGPSAKRPTTRRLAEFAKRFNSMPKFVVSTTLEEATWQNTTILRSLDDVASLKEEIDGEILVAGSNTLVHGDAPSVTWWTCCG